MEELDLSAMKRFFLEQGERRILEKQDYFVRQGERSGRVAYVEDGMFLSCGRTRKVGSISSGIASATVSWPNTPRAFVPSGVGRRAGYREKHALRLALRKAEALLGNVS